MFLQLPWRYTWQDLKDKFKGAGNDSCSIPTSTILYLFHKASQALTKLWALNGHLFEVGAFEAGCFLKFSVFSK